MIAVKVTFAMRIPAPIRIGLIIMALATTVVNTIFKAFTKAFLATLGRGSNRSAVTS